ncbi:MAG: T9SS type A sorting domain-containing protein [Bacteroidales bacterium]|nr:T9SS type A sorting domain-containing protein [Bacteroidales bacterium]
MKKILLPLVLIFSVFALYAQSALRDQCEKTLPYIEDFENLESYSNDFPECWSKIFSYQSSLGYDCPTISPTGADGSSGSLFFMLEGAASQFAISPMIDQSVPIRNTTVKLRYKSSQTTAVGLVLGVMTDPTDTLTFIPVDTIHRVGATSTWEQKEINMASYTGNGHYIALWHSGRVSSYSYPSCFVDNFKVELSASCTAPIQIAASVNNDEATISWTPTDNTTAVRIYYKQADSETYETYEVALGTSQHTIEGLNLGTQYEYYLVSICGDDESQASEIYYFSTPCEEITEFPWIEDFEHGLMCWTLDASANDQNWVVSTNPAHPSCTPTSGTQVASFDAYNFYDAWATITSPAIDLSESRILSFNMYRYGPQINFYNNEMPYDDKIEIYVNDQPTTEDATLLGTVNGYSDAEGWKEFRFVIPQQTANRSYLTLKGISDFGYNLHIDDLRISNIGATTYGTVDSEICEGETIIVNGTVYSETGTYIIDTLFNANSLYGDSIVYLNLVVNPRYDIIINASINEGETYTENGFNESIAGTYQHELTSIHGCDSIVTLNLDVVTGIVENDAKISIAPNPAHNYAVLITTGLEAEGKITITDMCGKVQRLFAVAKGNDEIIIERGDLPAGVYVIRLETEKMVLIDKLSFR